MSATACATSHAEAEATAALHAKADPPKCYCRLIFHNTIATALPYLIQSMHRNVGSFNVLQVSLSIIPEIIGDAEPARQDVGLVTS